MVGLLHVKEFERIASFSFCPNWKLQAAAVDKAFPLELEVVNINGQIHPTVQTRIDEKNAKRPAAGGARRQPVVSAGLMGKIMQEQAQAQQNANLPAGAAPAPLLAGVAAPPRRKKQKST
jgi:hypothetical protein